MFDTKTIDAGFGTGAVVDKPDERDFVFAGSIQPFDWELGFDIELLLGYRLWCGSEADFYGAGGKAGWGYNRYKAIVEEVKLKSIPPFIIPPKDQNGSSSCTGQGASMYLQVLNFLETGQWVEISAKDIYKWISLGANQGATLRDAMKRCVTPGVSTEALVPSYNAGNPPSEAFMLKDYVETEPIKAARKILASKEFKVINWDPSWLDAFAWAMLLNFGVYGGIIGSNNGTWMSEKPAVPVDGQVFWGHAIYFGKARKEINKRLGIINSWGKGAGYNGWQMLTENWATATVLIPGNSMRSAVLFNPWTLIDKENKLMTVKILKVKFADNKTFGVMIDGPNGTQIIKATGEEQWRSWAKEDSYQLKTVNPDGTSNFEVDLVLNF